MFSMADHNSLVSYKINLVNPDKHLKNRIRIETIRVCHMSKGKLFHKSFVSHLCVHMSMCLLNHTVIFFKNWESQ